MTTGRPLVLAALGRAALLPAVALFGPVAAVLAVWLPVLVHYHVADPVILPEAVARLRQVPSDAVLQRLDEARFAMGSRAGGDIRVAADEILRGRYRTGSGETVAVRLEPTTALLSVGSPMAQLEVSCLVVSQVLLDAYRATGEQRYFGAALQSALAWSRFEKAAWLPVGFLWNDHAIAGRMVVLTDLWREYRRRGDFDPVLGGEILAFVARSAALLARNSHYTARTNHGIMQNLGLLYVAAAFPDLPGVEGHIALAMDRLALHLPYYVSPDGVVLEHSAGYQNFALNLLRYALEYADVLGLAAPSGLKERYEAAWCFRRHFSRPDGSVPSYGDTRGGRREPVGPVGEVNVSCRQQGPSWIDQDFGYASIHGFSEAADQLFMAWANFPGQAHKHSDELAAWLWLDGRDWWAGSGYWPYDDPAWWSAVSWRGANAPHRVGEAPSLDRDSRLLGLRDSDVVPFLDVERRAADGSVYRRQIAGLGSAGVLVLDSATGDSSDARFETVWTLEPGIAVRSTPHDKDAYELLDVLSGRSLRAIFFGGASHTLQRLRGSRDPFAGLIAIRGEIHPTEAVITSAAFGAWSGALWQRSASTGAVDDGQRARHWNGPEHWSVSVAQGTGSITLSREGARLTLQSADAGHIDLPLMAGAASRPELDRAIAQYRRVSRQFPVFEDHLKYRWRATLGIGLLAAIQIAGVWVLGRLGVGAGLRAVLVVGAWAATSGWLYYQYLI